MRSSDSIFLRRVMSLNSRLLDSSSSAMISCKARVRSATVASRPALAWRATASARACALQASASFQQPKPNTASSTAAIRPTRSHTAPLASANTAAGKCATVFHTYW